MSAEYKIGLQPVADNDAQGAAKDVFENAKTNLGFIPNMYRTMANSPGYLGTYANGYNAFRQGSGFTPQEQETVFLTLSRENGCDYCTAAHSMIADKISKLGADELTAVRSGDALPDAKLNALSAFTKHVHDERGLIGKSAAEAFIAAGYSENQILEVILALSVKILSNYSNHIFHTGVDEAFSSYKV
ncbi:MAG: alkylhydroperoxidase [Hyphomicrobiales bacterium]|nr:MAG: alkylhydroperoxidase [Hyphomicrobiales bacterium]